MWGRVFWHGFQNCGCNKKWQNITNVPDEYSELNILCGPSKYKFGLNFVSITPMSPSLSHQSGTSRSVNNKAHPCHLVHAKVW